MNVLPDIKVASQLGDKAAPQAVGDELWFKDAIVYQLHVKAFADSNNDGIGDFAGLTAKLDYLHLGVTALWLLPFYPRLDATTATTLPIMARSIPTSARCGISSAS